MKVAIYCRLSEEDRNKLNESDDSNSIQNQKAMLLQYSIEQGWEVYNIYSDDDYTGSDRRRPEFNRLIKDAENHCFDIILCKTQSRFTRELELVEKYIHGLFPIWGIRFIGLVDNADTANKGNKKSRQINGLVNEWYLEDMSENIRSVLTNRRQSGYFIGAFAPYGYKKDPDKKGHLIIDEEAACIVREIFTMFAQGMGKTNIARKLNARGIPNPTEYKAQHGDRYQRPPNQKGVLWQYFTIADILTNETYIGNLVQGRYGSISYKTKICKPRPKSEWYIVPHTHEPIIDQDLWNTVQTLIRERAKPFSTGKIGIFARKVRCANCGQVMRSCSNRGRRYLKCSTRNIGPDLCIGSFIPVSYLEQAVLTELHTIIQNYLDIDKVEAGVVVSSGLAEKKKALLVEKASYERTLNDYKKGLKDLYMDKFHGVISAEDFQELSKALGSERQTTERALSEIEAQLCDIEEKLKVNNSKRELVLKYINCKHLTSSIVSELIDYIVVGKRIPGTRKYPVEIHWNF